MPTAGSFQSQKKHRNLDFGYLLLCDQQPMNGVVYGGNVTQRKATLEPL